MENGKQMCEEPGEVEVKSEPLVDVRYSLLGTKDGVSIQVSSGPNVVDQGL